MHEDKQNHCGIRQGRVESTLFLISKGSSLVTWTIEQHSLHVTSNSGLSEYLSYRCTVLQAEAVRSY